MRIKFVKTKKMPEWKGAGGLWRDGQVQDLPDHVAERLLSLYESPFVKVGGKQISPPSDKMIRQAEETKAEEQTDESEKPVRSPDESKKSFNKRLKIWEKAKKKK